MDRNDLAYWFPILEGTGVPLPRTEILRVETGLSCFLHGETHPEFPGLCDRIRAAAAGVGYPAFLRTGQGSGKHSWRNTCFLKRPEDVEPHVFNLVEWSELVDFLGLSTRTWVVREFLDLDASFTAFAGMPVAKEYRCFIRDGEVSCAHPYWPAGAIKDPSVADWRSRLASMYPLGDPEEATVRELARRVARVFDGAWSLDLARHRNGTWYATDMAEAVRSFHWPSCPLAPTPLED